MSRYRQPGEPPSQQPPSSQADGYPVSKTHTRMMTLADHISVSHAFILQLKQKMCQTLN